MSTKGLTLNDAKYSELKIKLKEKGMTIEDGNGLLDMQTFFNNMIDSEKEKIAASFDSQLDLELKDDIMAIMKETGVNRYIDLLSNKKCVEKLKKAGIVVQATDKNGNIVKKPGVAHRDWQISRVDEDGKVIQDQNGKLEQFKWKDFNSDSYIQGAEANVNELLAAAGYDCVSKLKASDIKAIASSSTVGIGESSSDLFNASGSKFDMNNMFHSENYNFGLDKIKITQSEYDKKYQELLDKGYTEEFATIIMTTEYELID